MPWCNSLKLERTRATHDYKQKTHLSCVFDTTITFADHENLCTAFGIMFLYAFNQKLLTKTYSYVMVAVLKVNGQGHRQNNYTIGILDHQNMGIAFGIVFLPAVVSVLRPFL